MWTPVLSKCIYFSVYICNQSTAITKNCSFVTLLSIQKWQLMQLILILIFKVNS